MITEILDFLSETGTYETSKRIKKGVESNGRSNNGSTVNYGKRLSLLKELNLVEKSDTQRNKWRISNRGRKWLTNEIDLRKL